MEYQGPDRRVHRVYVTRNTEYHVRAGVCVAVKNRQHTDWTGDHPAVGRKLEGALRFEHGGILPTSDEPSVGDAIYFRRGDRDLITSKVERVERPTRAVVVDYPN